MAGDPGRMGATRIRDLLAVGVVAAVAGYVLTRFNYSAFPRLPRLAGLTAALLGIGEAVAGWGLRRRIRERSDPRQRPSDRPLRPPVPPLTAARALSVAKASALAAAALIGLWLGFGAYVAPSAARAPAPAGDTATAVVGFVCAWIMLAGALYLEYCCRTPHDEPPGGTGDNGIR